MALEPLTPILPAGGAGGALTQGPTTPSFVELIRGIDLDTDEGLRTFEIFSKTDVYKRQLAGLTEVEKAGEAANLKKEQDKKINQLMLQLGEAQFGMSQAEGEADIRAAHGNVLGILMQLKREGGVTDQDIRNLDNRALKQAAARQAARDAEATAKAALVERQDTTKAALDLQAAKDKAELQRLKITNESEEKQELIGQLSEKDAQTRLGERGGVNIDDIVLSLTPADRSIVRSLQNAGASDEVIFRALRSKGLI